jgi:hypothetical protein
VRGRFIPMKFQVLGPFVREGLPKRPFLLGLANAVNASTRIERKQGTCVPCLLLLHPFQLGSKGQSRGSLIQSKQLLGSELRTALPVFSSLPYN